MGAVIHMKDSVVAPLTQAQLGALTSRRIRLIRLKRRHSELLKNCEQIAGLVRAIEAELRSDEKEVQKRLEAGAEIEI